MDLLETLGEHPIAETLKAKGIDSVEKLADQYGEAQKFISSGRKGQIPGKGSTEQEWAEYRAAIGVPESADGYDVGDRGEFTDHATTLREAAHEAGVTPEQFSKMLDATQEALHGSQQKAAETLKQLHAKYEQAGKDRWGPDFETKSAEAKRAFDSLVAGDEELKGVLDQTGLSSHPAIIDLFSRLNQINGGPDVPEDSGTEVPKNEQERQLVELIDKAHEIAASEEFRSRKHPGHRSAIVKYQALQQQVREAMPQDVQQELSGGILSSQYAKDIQQRVRGYAL